MKNISKIKAFSLIITTLLTIVVVNITSVKAEEPYVVNDLADDSDANLSDHNCATISGTCTLRAAIEQANFSGGNREVNFEVNGTINTASVLEINSNDIIVNAGDTHTVVLVGSGMAAHNGFSIIGSNNQIIGLVIENFNYGIYINGGASGNTIENNYIGTSADGESAAANAEGVYISHASYNIIANNLISGNEVRGVRISESDSQYNEVSGNYIGVNASGDADLSGNAYYGVQLTTAANYNDIEDNVISGHRGSGLAIQGSGADSNYIGGNYIGTDATGEIAIANEYHGVYVFAGAQSNMIENNVISGNLIYGVNITSVDTSDNFISSNKIGTNAIGDTAVANGRNGVTIGDASNNTISNNVISGNNLVGVYINSSSDPAENNTIYNNKIGTNADGDEAIANGSHGIGLGNDADNNLINANLVSGNVKHGISIAIGSNNTITNNKIGTNDAGDGAIANTLNGVIIKNASSNNNIENNVIAYNSEFGISIINSGADYNQISENSIYSNTRGGISLYGGANQAIVTPVISTAANGGATETITLSGTCPIDASGITVEIFTSEYGQGKIFIDSVTSVDGNWSYNLTGAYTAVDTTLVVTATDSNDNTSVFSPEFTISDINAVASAVGSDLSVNEGEIAVVRGDNSYDPNYGDSLTYSWTHQSGEAVGDIDKSDTAIASFVAPEITGGDSSVTLRLIVNGGEDHRDVIVNILNVNDVVEEEAQDEETQDPEVIDEEEPDTTEQTNDTTNDSSSNDSSSNDSSSNDSSSNDSSNSDEDSVDDSNNDNNDSSDEDDTDEDSSNENDNDEDDITDDTSEDDFEEDSTEEVAQAQEVSKVTANKRGKIKVTFSDGTTNVIKVFNIKSKKKTKIKQYKDTDYYLVLAPKGKKLALVNALTGEIVMKKKVNKKKYNKNSLKVLTIHNKKFAVVTSKKKKKVKLTIFKININNEKIKKKSAKILKHKKNVKVSKTKKKKQKIQLRNKKGKMLAKYKVTKKKYKLKKI